ncbi:hypothetical protein ACLB2K_077429 [Fragaria x ananassa]
MYPAMLEVSVRVPFQRVIQEWLSGLGVAPAQINTNGYRMVIALVALWREQYGGDPPVEALHHLLSLKENASATNDPIKGFFCLIPKRPAIVTDLPSVAKSWRNKWFYVKGWSIATKKSGDPDPDPELVTCFKDVGKRRKPLAPSEVVKKKLEPFVRSTGGAPSPLPSHSKPESWSVRDGSLSSGRRVSPKPSFDLSDKASGKRKMGDEGLSRPKLQKKKKKKLRVEGQEEGFMTDAQRESRFSKTPKHGNSPAHSRMIGVPDFLSAYVEDVVRIVDSKSFMAKFGEKELEGELDFLLDGAKGLMLKAGLKVHLIIDRMASRICELDSLVSNAKKELMETRTQLDQGKKDMAKLDQVEVKENEYLLKFQGSQEYKDTLEASYLDGFADLLSRCTERFGEKKMGWALDPNVDPVPSVGTTEGCQSYLCYYGVEEEKEFGGGLAVWGGRNQAEGGEEDGCGGERGGGGESQMGQRLKWAFDRGQHSLPFYREMYGHD